MELYVMAARRPVADLGQGPVQRRRRTIGGMTTPGLQPTLPPDEGAHLPDQVAIARLVHTFYGRVRTDWLLGPVFETAVDDWSRHLDTLVRFW